MKKFEVGDVLEITNREFCKTTGIKVRIVKRVRHLYELLPFDTSHCIEIGCTNYDSDIRGCAWHEDYINEEYMKKVNMCNRNGANK